MNSTVATAALTALVMLPITAAAQQVGPMVASDLNGDGQAERFALIDNGQGSVDLQIENTGAGVIYADGIAWIGGLGQEPALSLAANGSVLLTSMNESIGRDRWHMTLTIAYRNNEYRVAGFTFDQYDTIEPDTYQLCDLNLLTGRGIIQKGDNGAHRAVRTNQQAVPVTQWKDTTPIPKACEIHY